MTTHPLKIFPLAVWDARDTEWPRTHARGAYAWAIDKIPELGRTYRIEFYKVDMPFAIVSRYALDAPATITHALDAPVTIPLDELPPEHLMVDTAKFILVSSQHARVTL
jgi:hypothetical protein